MNMELCTRFSYFKMLVSKAVPRVCQKPQKFCQDYFSLTAEGFALFSFDMINIYTVNVYSFARNEELAIKIAREKFLRKCYCSTERKEVSALESPAKCFSRWISNDLEVWVENSVSAIQHIENRKCFTEVHSPPRARTIPFAYSCSLTFHTLYKNGMIG